MTEEGFEPSPPKRLVPETSALDRSAIQPMFLPPWTSPVRRNMSWTSKKWTSIQNAPAGNQTRVSSVAGTYTITVLPAPSIFVLGFEPRISRVLGERHDQARPYEHMDGVSGFRSQYLVLAKHARFRLRQYPVDKDIPRHRHIQ